MKIKLFFVLLILLLICIACSESTHSGDLESLKNGLIGYYTFSGNADDNSNNDNHATVYEASLTADQQGFPASAYYFNGDNSFIDLHIIQMPVFSVGFWFNGLNGAMISTHENGDNTNNFFLQLNAYGCGIAVRGIQGWWENDMCADTTGTYNDSNWHYITFTSDSGNHKLYLDGALADTLSGNPVTDERPFILGRREAEGNFQGFYTGSLDEVRIYNRILTEYEIDYLYTNKK